MRLVNLTLHAIHVIPDNGTPVILEPSGRVARCSSRWEQVGEVNGIPVSRVVYGEVTGLPEPEPDTMFLVSALVARAAVNRSDLLIVDDTIRDDEGRIIGCRGFARV